MLMATHVYIHGLNSSGVNNSTAKLIQSTINSCTVYSPSYDSSQPFDVNFQHLIEQIIDNIDVTPDTIIFGSSLGGVYAEQLAQHFNAKCVLFNPVVQSEQLTQFIGEQTCFADNTHYQITQQLIDSYDLTKRSTIPLLVYASNNDSVLKDNFDKVCKKYQGRAQIIKHSGDHRLTEIDSFLADNIQQMENWLVIY